MTSFQAQVREFHERCGFYVGALGAEIPLEVRRSRAKLVWEEMREVLAELLSDDPQTLLHDYGIKPPAGTDGDPMRARPVDPAKLAHEIADGHYVLSGGSVNGGWDEGPVFAVVHAANLSKAYLADREVGDEHGKARKPNGWQSPDVRPALRPYDPGTENAEQAARWLAEESRHPLYQGDGWRLLLKDPSKVDHAVRQATGLMTPAGTSQQVKDASDVLLGYIRSMA